MNIIQQLEAEQAQEIAAKREIPEFGPGDTVVVAVRVTEGERRGGPTVGPRGRRRRVYGGSRTRRLGDGERDLDTRYGGSAAAHRSHDQRLRGGLSGESDLPSARDDLERAGGGSFRRESHGRTRDRGAHLIGARRIPQRERDR